MKYISQNLRCLVCDRKGVDLHHIKTRKSGGSDGSHNIMPLCREHHTEVHQIGLFKFSQKGVVLKLSSYSKNKTFNYDNVSKWLTMKKWEKDDDRRKWTHPVEHGQACVVCFNEECVCKPMNSIDK